MRKTVLFLIVFIQVAFTGIIVGQTGSVSLRNGAGGLISTHASITEAYGVIPATLSQAYIIELEQTYTGASETYPITFVAKTGASQTNTITLRPAAGVSSMLIQATQAGANLMTINDADFMIIDGRAGGVGTTGVLTFNNLGTTSNSNTIVFINGAVNNIVRFCNINNGTTGSAGRGLSFSTSASNPSGNSNNRVEYCKFASGRYMLNSNGTAANRNRNNTIYGCTFENIIFVGIWYQAGTSNITIDSCSMFNNTNSGDGPFGILFDGQADTAIVRNNQIHSITGTGTIKGINIRSTLSGGTNVSYIYNNFISLTPTGTNTTVTGIEYAGANSTNATILNNSVLIGGTLPSGGTSGNVVSSPFLRSSSNVGNSFIVENNLFKNTRSGGTAGVQHTAVAFTSTVGTITINNNTYNGTAGSLARWGATLYADLATYQAALAPNETTANEANIEYVSTSDLHLTGSSIGNPALLGVSNPLVTTDIDFQLRGNPPYRGADEATPVVLGCSGIPTAGTAVSTPGSVCSGAQVNLTLSGLNPGEIPALSFQWLSSTDGINFSPISGAVNQTYSTNISQNTFFSCQVTCTVSMLSDTSAAVQSLITPVPQVASITETHTVVGQYQFSALGVQNASSYLWNSGNSSTSTSPNPTFNYTVGGNYTVSVIVSNACGSDTAFFNLFVGCDGTPPGGNVIPNGTNFCASQNFNLNMTGLNSLILPTLTLQWQSSLDGTNFTDIPGANGLTYGGNLTQSTYYRCEVTCTTSGLSANSNVVLLNFIPLPNAGSILETHNAASYQFSLQGLSNATGVLWNFGNGVFASGTTANHTYATGGNYTVTAIASNQCGSDTASLNINVGCDLAPGTFTINVNPDPSCVGDAIVFSLSGLDSIQVPFYSYQWLNSVNGSTYTNILGANSSTYSGIAGTETFFRCTVSCPSIPNSSVSEEVTANIEQAPSAQSITVSYFMDNSGYNVSLLNPVGNFSVLWDFGTGDTSTELSPDYFPAANGVYTVTAILTNACGSDTLTVEVIKNVSITESDLTAAQFSIMPNPSSDIFQIKSEINELQIKTIYITDITGKQVYAVHSGINLPLTVSAKALGLAPGLYHIHIQTNSAKTILRLLVNE